MRRQVHQARDGLSAPTSVESENDPRCKLCRPCCISERVARGVHIAVNLSCLLEGSLLLCAVDTFAKRALWQETERLFEEELSCCALVDLS